MSIEAAAKAVNDGGWTCDLHEPEPFGDCQRCVDLQRQLARNVLIAFAGDRVLYVDHDRCSGVGEYWTTDYDWGSSRGRNIYCTECDGTGHVQVYPEPPK